MATFGAAPGAWWASLALGGKLYGVPCNAECLLVYDPSTEGLATVDTRRVARGEGKWRSAAALGGRIYAVPDRADQMLVYDVVSGNLCGISTRELARGQSKLKWQSCAVLAGKVYGIPHNADQLLIYDPASGQLSGVSTASVAKGPQKWLANIVLGGKVYGMPCNASKLLVYDPVERQMSGIDVGHLADGPFKWLSAVALGGKLYGIPCHAECILSFDPSTGDASAISTSGIASGPGKWLSAVALGDKIYGVPDHADVLLVFDPDAGSVSGVDISGIATGPFKWQTAATLAGCVHAAPYNAEKRLIFNPGTGEVSSSDTCEVSSGSAKWGTSVVLNGKVYAMPYDARQILVHGRECDLVAEEPPTEEEGEQPVVDTDEPDVHPDAPQEFVEDFVASWLSQWIYDIEDASVPCPVGPLSFGGTPVDFSVPLVYEEPLEGSPARIGTVLATLPKFGRVLYIVFKGSSSLSDFIVNANVSPDYSPFAMAFGDRTTFVHHGAYHAIVQLRVHRQAELYAQLASAAGQGVEHVVVTGHSLGGQYALAFLLGILLGSKQPNAIPGVEDTFSSGKSLQEPVLQQIRESAGRLLDGCRVVIFGSPMCFGAADGADVRPDVAEFIRTRSVNYVNMGDPAPRLWSELDIEGFVRYFATHATNQMISGFSRRFVDWACGPGGLQKRAEDMLRRPDIEAQVLRPGSRYQHLSRIRLLSERYRPWRPLGESDICLEDHSINHAYIPNFLAALDASEPMGLFDEDGNRLVP